MTAEFVNRVDEEIKKAEDLLFDLNLKLASLNAVMCVNPSDDCEMGLTMLIEKAIVTKAKLKAFKGIRNEAIGQVTMH